LTRKSLTQPETSLACRRAKGAPGANGAGHGVPASERVGGSAGAKPPGSKEVDEKILDEAREFFGM
jgi:hypothetical protein